MLEESPQDPHTAETDADVIVVGHGPTGAVLSILLAQSGWRVIALERRKQPYLLPRATSFDGETARLLAATGIAGELDQITEAATGYQCRTASGEPLVDIEFALDGPYGWPDANTMHQPDLESLLAARAAALPGVTLLRGRRVAGISDREKDVVVRVDSDAGVAESFSARWVVGCDGANSFVREHLGTSVTDLGFSYEWLLCDVELRDSRVFVPTNVQICDPARPTTLVGSGPGHRRFEFMRLPGERAAELNREETAWRLLAPHAVTPETANLLRSTTYLFHARWAEQWRVGHVLLAGDAAHLMPPFAGQGMCSGIRDVVSLSWRLDLLLRGLTADHLLDGYTEERRTQVRASILSSVQLGRMICVTDPQAASARDVTVLAGRRGRGPARPEPARPLVCGLLTRGPSGTGIEPPTGEVVPQGRVLGPSGTGLFDDIVGRGFVLLFAPGAAVRLDGEQRSFLTRLGAHVVQLEPGDRASSRDASAPGPLAAGGARDGDGVAVTDVDGVYRRYLARYGVDVLLVRPDYHVFGAGTGVGAAAALVDDLRSRLGAAVPAGSSGRPA
jgi:flavoprotein hydroxylase